MTKEQKAILEKIVEAKTCLAVDELNCEACPFGDKDHGYRCKAELIAARSLLERGKEKKEKWVPKVGDRISHTWSFSSQYVSKAGAIPELKVAEPRKDKGVIVSILNGVALFKRDDGQYRTAAIDTCRRLRPKKKERREWWVADGENCSCTDGCSNQKSNGCIRVREVVKAAKGGEHGKG